MKSEREIIEFIKSDGTVLNILCRICLTCNGNQYLFENKNDVSLLEKIALCTSVRISEEDSLPQKICEDCARELNAADQFRSKCLYSDNILKKFISEKNNQSPVLLHIKTEIQLEENLKSNNDMTLNFLNKESRENFKIKIEEESQEIKMEDFSYSGEDSFTQAYIANSANHICTQCNEEFRKKSQLNSHLKNMHGVKRKYKEKEKNNRKNIDKPDNVCNNDERDSSIEQDSKIENMNTKFKVYKEVFMGRISGQGKERQYHCLECDYVTGIRKSFIHHTRKHTGEKPHVCDICNKAFQFPSSLIYHKKTHSEKNHTCPTCAKQFHCKQHYLRHLTVHTKEKKVICLICNKALKSKVTLQVHMNRHNNIKNYSCETCGALFVTVSELIGHSKTHTGEKKFACNICEFKSCKKTGLERHLKFHSGEKTFKCDHCEKICCTRGELKCHMRKHTKEKNYPCTVCEQKFMHSSSLNTHMLKVHKIKFKWRDMIDRRIVR